jgi:hypothetical protein
MTEMKKPTVFYFGLEPLKARYTYQLSTKWMPEAFGLQSDKVNFVDIPGEFDETQEIKVGAVLDAVGRGKYAMSQCANFLDMLNKDIVKDGDIVFGDYRYVRLNTYFNCMACLYPHWVSTIPYNERQGANPSEAVIMHELNSMHNWDIFVAALKQADGTQIVDHIGEVTKGKRVIPSDPGYEAFGWMDPDKRYCSRTGRELDPNSDE